MHFQLKQDLENKKKFVENKAGKDTRISVQNHWDAQEGIVIVFQSKDG
jgi:hypothetical protein